MTEKTKNGCECTIPSQGLTQTIISVARDQYEVTVLGQLCEQGIAPRVEVETD